MPLAAAFTICADTIPPPSLTFNKYCWSFPSKSLQRRRSFPCFWEAVLVHFHHLVLLSLLPFPPCMPYWWNVQKTHWQGGQPFRKMSGSCHAYLPISAQTLGQYLRKGTHISVTCNSFSYISPSILASLLCFAFLIDGLLNFLVC